MDEKDVKYKLNNILQNKLLVNIGIDGVGSGDPLFYNESQISPALAVLLVAYIKKTFNINLSDFDIYFTNNIFSIRNLSEYILYKTTK